MPDQTVLEMTEVHHPSRVSPKCQSTPGLPLVTIAGASGKTSTGWLLIELLEHADNEVGAWISDGVYVDHEIRPDELHAWELAMLATRAREINVLVQEIPSVLAANLPPESTWIAVLTSICGSDDHCQRQAATGRDRQAVEAVCATVRRNGRIVANADDLMIVDAASASGRAITYYAMNGGNPVLRNHIDTGGDAVWIQNGWVKAQISGSRQRLTEVTKLPATLDGHLIFQVQNALASIAAYAAICSDNLDLSVLSTSDEALPTAIGHSGVSIISDDDRSIVADQPASLLAVKHLVRGVRSFGPKRVIHVLGTMDALDDEDVVEAARVVGSLGGIAILAVDGDENERTERIKEGLMMSVNPPAIVVRDSEDTTFAYLQTLLEAGDVALVLDHTF